MQLGPPKEKVTSKDFMAKFSSKREVYNFLSIDVGAYLPSYGKSIVYSALILFLNPEQVTIYFIKDLLNGKKKSKSPHLGVKANPIFV